MTKKRVDEALSSQFGALLVRYVDKSLATENAESGHIGFIAAPGFFRRHVFKGASGRDVVQVSGIRESVIPVGIG